MAYLGMVDAPLAMPDLDALYPATLKAMFLVQQSELLSHKAQIEHLQLLIAKLRRMQFGRSSEKIGRQIEQLELQLEELEAAAASEPVSAEAPTEPTSTTESVAEDKTPRRRKPLPSHLPRETRTHLPKEEGCTKCGGAFRCWVKMCRRCWSTSRPASRWFVMFGPDYAVPVASVSFKLRHRRGRSSTPMQVRACWRMC
jgi:hypothetical protein